MKIHFYDNKFKNAIDNYELTEEQLRYTKHPKDCIQLVNEDLNRYSIVAMEGNKLVIFFVLHKNDGVKPYSNNNKSILLRSFSTDFRFQGRGYAKNALIILPKFVKENFTQTNAIVLAVNSTNKVALRLYKNCGFVDEGVREMGPKGELMIMHYYL